MKRLTSLLIFAAAPLCMVAQAQYYPQPQPQQLDVLVGPIALYPDPLLAQVLSAATFYNDIPDADGWARQHAGLSPDDQARAIYNDGLPWDPSVIALLPFPAVLDTMASDMNWTSQLGNAVLADRGAVMDAVQRARATAMNYGYLQNNNQYRVVNGGYNDIQIMPVDPAVIYVPYYDPYVVYSRPQPGFFIGGAITFGPRVTVGAFAPWTSRSAWARPYVSPRPQFNERAYQVPAFRQEQRPVFQQPAVRQPEVRQQPQFSQRQQSLGSPRAQFNEGTYQAPPFRQKQRPVFQQPAVRQPEVRPQPQVPQQQSFRQPEFRQQPQFSHQQSFRQPEPRGRNEVRGPEDHRR
jgi:hypothetical protein